MTSKLVWTSDPEEAVGFVLVRRESHAAIAELVNLQNVNGEAKAYQLRQFLKLVERYDLRLETEE